MTNIGITGSLSSGKSTVAKILSNGKHPIFSADREVKALYSKNFFIRKVKKKFRLNNSKNIKKQIKSLIQKDKKKLRDLEKIIHPLVRKNMRKFMKKKNKTKIFEIPLLIESKLTHNFDFIISVAAQKKIRLKRYLNKGGTKKIFTILDNRQLKMIKKIQRSDYVIYNNRTLKNLKKKVTRLKIFL